MNQMYIKPQYQLLINTINMARMSPNTDRTKRIMIETALRVLSDLISDHGDSEIQHNSNYHYHNSIYVSKAYKERGFIQKEQICEHAVPISVIRKHLESDLNHRVESIISMLRFVVITKDEDRLLRNARLQNTMPKNWRFGGNIYERYRLVGIEVVKRY